MTNKYLLATFSDEEQLLDAFEVLTQHEVDIEEVFSPYPIHEILLGMGNKTRMTHFAFTIGLFAVMGLLGVMYYISTQSWPLVFGGKPYASFPAFIVVTIVATILIITIATIALFQLRANLYPGKKATPYTMEATNDKFVIMLHLNQNQQHYDFIYKTLQEKGVEQIEEKIIQ